MATWHTPETARLLWPDAARLDDDVLNVYLGAAIDAIVAYAPPLNYTYFTVDGGDSDGEVYGYALDGGYSNGWPLPSDITLPGDIVIPETWALAQVMHARNIYNSAKAAPNGDFDGSGYGISAYPLDWQIKQLLRPRRGIGAIG